MVQVEQIVYCEAVRSYTKFHFRNNEAITVCKPLAEYDQLLESACFMRVHKSFLINLQHIKEYHRGEGGMLIMSNGVQIEVSRRRKNSFLDKLKALCWY